MLRGIAIVLITIDSPSVMPLFKALFSKALTANTFKFIVAGSKLDKALFAPTSKPTPND